MNHTLTTEQINGVLAYLATKPFQEVHQLIPMLQQAPVQNLEENAVTAAKPALVPDKSKA